MTDHRFVTFTSAKPPITVTAMRGELPPIPEGGYGGWQITPRPRRKSLTIWAGIDPLQTQVTIVLGISPAGDAYALDTSAEPDREKLERLARPANVGSEPPLVRVTGAVPHASSVNWVIANFDWDSSPIYSLKGFLVRQAVTVHLLEHVADDVVAPQSAASQARTAAAGASTAAAKAAGVTANQTTKQKTYVVRAGDTLSSIAAKLLGSYKRYPELATLNGIRDPNNITAGQHLRLP